MGAIWVKVVQLKNGGTESNNSEFKPKKWQINMNKVSVSSGIIHQRHCWIGILDKTICIQTLLKDPCASSFLCYSSWPFWKFNLRLCCMEKCWNCTGVIESSHFMSLLYICVWKYGIPVFLIFQVENRQFKNKSNRLIFYCTDLWEVISEWCILCIIYMSICFTF